jgi:hypothetical protein
MLKTIFLIIISFFAVIGILECFLNALESVSVSKYQCVDQTELRVYLSGHIDDVAFLMNTLMFQGERIRYKTADTKVTIVDNGLDDNTYDHILQICHTNSNISIEKKN